MSRLPSYLQKASFSLLLLQPLAAQAQVQDEDIAIVPNGSVSDAGWALGRLNDGADLSSVSYNFPDTTTPVRLYLIDTAVSNPNGWFDANSNLTIGESTLVRGSNDPTSSSAFTHGTRMLSVIAGPETGAATGTPIEVVSFDVYPGGEEASTNVALLISAISDAYIHHLSNPGTPGVICIANGSTNEIASSSLSNMIDTAVDAGLTVIVSAGNAGENASNFIPSAYGSSDGVICVGASDESNSALSSSNFGSAVDLYAPGKNVRSLKFNNPASGSYDLITGTSPATGLVTAAALSQLSLSPELSPAELEASLKANAYSGSVSILQVAASDSDGDGASDALEAFMGTDPGDLLDQPSGPRIGGTSEQYNLSFTIAASEFDASNPYELNNGTTWRVLFSTDLSDWSEIEGSISLGEPDATKIPVIFSAPAVQDSGYLRLEISPAP